MSLLELRGLSVGYPGSERPVVDGLSFAVDAGEAVGLAGESGAGKTQTALAVMGLLPDGARASGAVLFDGRDLLRASERELNRVRARRIAMIFQDPGQALNPYLKIGAQLRRILIEHAVVPRRGLGERARALLQRVGLPDAARLLACYPHELSGGMKQRAMIAMALAGEPELLIADEPTTALDVTVQAQILELLARLRAESGIALLLITHDLGVIAAHCDRLLVMQGGKLLEGGATRDVFRAPREAHTRALIAAAARIDAPPPEPPAAAADPAGRQGPVLEIERLTVSFGATGANAVPLRAVRGLSVTLGAGETLAVVGESGSGKTTVARAVVGLAAPADGVIRFLGAPLPRRAADRDGGLRRRLQMVFQDPVGSLNPAMRVGDTLDETLRWQTPRLPRDERAARVDAMLGRVGLERSLLNRFPHALSGGQAQRVAIARALLLDPAVLICDEAVAALDGTVRREILELLRAEQRRSGLSIVFITHDLAVVRRLSHRVLVMYMGRTCEIADNARLFERPRHPYTRALMDAVPRPDPDRPRRPPPVSGETPSVLDPPPGCAFHPRCPFAVERCRRELPEPGPAGGSLAACHRAAELDLGRAPDD